MELEEFVYKTIEQINSAAAKLSQDTKCVVNPPLQINLPGQLYESGNYNPVTPIDFDIALTVAGAKETTGGGRLEVFSILNLGAEKGSKLEHSEVSRVRFTLNVGLDAGEKKETPPRASW